MVPILVTGMVDGPPAPPGVSTYLDTLVQWVLNILAWAGGVAFLAVGGMFLFAYFGQFESNRALRALAATCIGCIIVSTASGIGARVLAGSSGMKGTQDKLNEIAGWIASVLGWAGGIAFICVGGLFLITYFDGHGNMRAVRALGGASIGCIIISAAGTLARILLKSPT